MRIDYKLNPFIKSPFLDKLDRDRRTKIESTLGKSFTDLEWIKYKKMVMPKSETQK